MIISCNLYQQGPERYFLVRLFSSRKIGISCKKRVFMYVCPPNKEVWFSFVDPNVEQSDGCGQTEARKWNKVWVFSMNNWRVDSDYYNAVDEVAADATPKKEEPPRPPKELPSTVLIKFDCEI